MIRYFYRIGATGPLCSHDSQVSPFSIVRCSTVESMILYVKRYGRKTVSSACAYYNIRATDDSDDRSNFTEYGIRFSVTKPNVIFDRIGDFAIYGWQSYRTRIYKTHIARNIAYTKNITYYCEISQKYYMFIILLQYFILKNKVMLNNVSIMFYWC
jgi:hypothetical protein